MKISGIKWVSGFPANIPKGLPTIVGIIVLNDYETGRNSCNSYEVWGLMLFNSCSPAHACLLNGVPRLFVDMHYTTLAGSIHKITLNVTWCNVLYYT